MRKTRSDSKLLNLPEEQQAQLAEWLLDGMPYHTAKETVAKEFGVSVSLPCFSSFWEEVCAPALITRRRRAVSTAEEIAIEASATPGRFDQATIDALKQQAFELSIKPNADPKQVKALFSLVLKARDQDLEERRVKLLEAKAALADQAKEIVESTASPEEQMAKIKAVFGMA
jgi:hypothetical protein